MENLHQQWNSKFNGKSTTLVHIRRSVLAWEDAMGGTPWNYLERCRVALTAYENGGELPLGRSMPPICSEDDSDSVPFDPGKPPPDPPETLNLFENQRYLSKLIQWGLDASQRRRSRPHLAERDDDEPSGSYYSRLLELPSLQRQRPEHESVEKRAFTRAVRSRPFGKQVLSRDHWRCQNCGGKIPVALDEAQSGMSVP